MKHRDQDRTSTPAGPAQLESLEQRQLLTVFTVTNTADSGTGSLRWALDSSNNTPGVDTIAFNLTASDKTIRPTSALPMVYDPAIVDGRTQPGYAGQPLVRIDGSLAGATDGLKMFGGSTLEGLCVTGFDGQGITTIPIANSGYGGNVIRYNWVGVDLTGAAAPNDSHNVGIYSPGNVINANVLGASTTGDGIWVMGNIFNSTNGYNTIENNLIGLDPTGTQARTTLDGIGIQDSPYDAVWNNVIAGATNDGILVRGSSTGFVIQGNLIGTDRTGTVAIGNAWYGIEVQSDHGTIGGTVASLRNVVANSGKAGIVFWLSGAHDNVVQGNYIGTDVTGTHAMGNAEQGIAFSDAGPNLVGGTTAGTGNVICANGHEGVGVFPGTGEVIEGNRIGVDAAGHAMGNGTWGVTVINTSSGCVVSGNVIANNPSADVWAYDGEATVTSNTATLPTPVHPGVFSVSTGNVLIGENAGYVAFKIIRTGGSDGTVTVHFATASRTAVAGVNYTAASATVTFVPGQVCCTVRIPLLDDHAVNSGRTFYVSLSAPTGGAAIGALPAIRVNVLNTDVATRVSRLRRRVV